MSLVNLGGDTWALFPWLGTYAFLALERVIKLRMPASLGIKGVDVSRPYYIQFRMAVSAEAFLDALEGVLATELDPLCLLYPKELPSLTSMTSSCPPSWCARALPRAFWTSRVPVSVCSGDGAFTGCTQIGPLGPRGLQKVSHRLL